MRCRHCNEPIEETTGGYVHIGHRYSRLRFCENGSGRTAALRIEDAPREDTAAYDEHDSRRDAYEREI